MSALLKSFQQILISKPGPLPSPHFTALQTISNVLSCSGKTDSFLPLNHLHVFFHPRDTLTFFFLLQLTTQLPETARVRQFLDRMAFEKTHVMRPPGGRGPDKAGLMVYKLPVSRTHAYADGKPKGVKLLVSDRRSLEEEREFLSECDAHDGLVTMPLAIVGVIASPTLCVEHRALCVPPSLGYQPPWEQCLDSCKCPLVGWKSPLPDLTLQLLLTLGEHSKG